MNYFSVGLAFTIGWKLDRTNKFVPFANLELVKKKSFLYTAETAQITKIPGDKICPEIT